MLIRLFLPKSRKPSSRAVSRREFFQQLWPISKAPETTLEQAAGPVARRDFRPPGAVGEAEFVTRCTGCALCADACTAGVIGPDSGGLAALDLNQTPCLACWDMPCIQACPEKALAPLAGIWQVRMGSASVRAQSCWQLTGERNCGQTCLAACPLPHSALKLYPGQAPNISRLVCIGCGLCVSACPSPGPGTIQVAIT